MNDTCGELYGVRTLQCAPEGKKFKTGRDAVDLIGEALSSGAQRVVIPVERLDEDFFRLRSGVAGQIVQKFVQYRRQLVILGDVSRFEEESSAFAAFVAETNRGPDIWFVRDVQELKRRTAL